ncbi:MAG TPA: DUF1761 domain-containing protein [Chryseosolibacter sp.]
MDFPINYLAILVATIASFLLSFIWYTVLFGKAWAVEMGYDTTQKPESGVMVKGMLLTLLGNFLLAYVFAHNNAAWSFVPGMDVMSDGASIANAAIFTWLGFFIPQDLGKVAWERKSWKLFFIDGGYHLAMLFVAATILILWK